MDTNEINKNEINKNEINKNDKIFIAIIIDNINNINNNYKKIINTINFQVYKNYYCLLILNKEDKILYNKINEYINLLNVSININIDINIDINNNNNISYAINKFFKSDCNYFTWIYENYNIDYFFLDNLIKIKSDFVYTSFKLINIDKNNKNNINSKILLDKKYNSKDNFFIENNISFKSFMWYKNCLYNICNNEYISDKNIINLNEYDFFYITFKIIDFENIKYSNKVLLEIINDNNNNNNNNKNNKNNIYLDNEKNDIIKKYCTNNKIINNNILNLYLPNINLNDNVYNNEHNNDIIISLASIPSRFLHIEFEDTIKSLFNQIIKPKYVILNLCNNYQRFPLFNIELYTTKIKFLQDKYNKLIINITSDYGPITKILGLYNLKYNNDIKINIGIDDKIIILDDDWTYINTLTYYYKLAYELYNCDAIFVDEKYLINWDNWWEYKEFNEEDNIIHNNYQGFAFGWLTYSIKYKYINKLFDYYSYIISINDKIINYDDLIISLFYKKFKLNTCGINLLFLKKKNSILDTVDPLRNINNYNIFKKDLEKKFMDINNINNINSDLFNIKPNKKIFYNIENLEFNNNNIFDISYFNEKILIITIINDNINNSLENNLDVNLTIRINNINYKILIKKKNINIKNTYFIKVDSLLNLEILNNNLLNLS